VNDNESHAVPDATLGGYISEHDRPPAFEGVDAQPYTVSIETEQTGNLRRPFAGYLVFPKWAETGLGIIGHVETPVLVEAQSAAEVTRHLSELTLGEVKEHLDVAIQACTTELG
jgi:hypothetical protein